MGFLVHLRDVGRRTAEAWLHSHFDSLGHESTMDLPDLFEDSFHPLDLPLET